MSTLKFYIIQQALHWFVLALPAPVLVLAQQTKGLNLVSIGIAASAYSITAMIGEVPFGIISDCLGRIKTYFFGMLLSVFGFVVFFSADTFAEIMIAQMLLGFSRAACSGTVDAWFVDRYTKETGKDVSQKIFGKVYFWLHIGLAAGALSGGIIAEYGAVHWVFGASAIVAVLLSIYVFVFVSEPQQSQKSKTIDAQVSRCMFIPREISSISLALWSLMSTNVAYALAFGGLGILWQPFFDDLTGNQSYLWLGVISSIYYFMGSLGPQISSLLYRHTQDEGKSLIILRLLQGLFFLFFLRIHSGFGFAIVYLTVFLLSAAETPLFLTILNRSVTERNRTTVLSIENFLKQVGGIVGVLSLPLLAETAGMDAAWIAAGFILMLSSLLFLKKLVSSSIHKTMAINKEPSLQ